MFYRILFRTRYFFSPMLIILGLVIGFLGNLYQKTIIFLGSLVCWLAVFYLSVAPLFFEDHPEKVTVQILNIVILVICIIISILISYFQRIGQLFLTGVSGWFIGLIFYVILVFKGDSTSSKAYFWCVNSIFAVIPTLFVLIKNPKTSFIHVTSIIGSYFLIRGISLVAPGFPNPMD